MEVDKINKEIEELRKRVNNNNLLHKHNKAWKGSFMMIYNIAIELFSGILVALLLKKALNIQNRLIFAILLLCFTCGGLYNLLKSLYIKKK